MSRGYEQHQLRHQGLSRFGKELTRRSNASCELCGANHVPLAVWEVPPVPQEPDFDHCIFICETCRDQLEHPKRRDPDHWHCLTRAIWSPVPAVQAVAVALLRALDPPWAAEQLENLYLDPDTEAWVEKIEL